jgi:hypothetical protein
MDIGGWLQSLGLEQYETAFHANAVDAEFVRDLTNEDLKKLGVLLVHRPKLLRAIAALDGGSAAQLDPGSRCTAATAINQITAPSIPPARITRPCVAGAWRGSASAVKWACDAHAYTARSVTQPGPPLESMRRFQIDSRRLRTTRRFLPVVRSHIPTMSQLLWEHRIVHTDKRVFR